MVSDNVAIITLTRLRYELLAPIKIISNLKQKFDVVELPSKITFLRVQLRIFFELFKSTQLADMPLKIKTVITQLEYLLRTVRNAESSK